MVSSSVQPGQHAIPEFGNTSIIHSPISEFKALGPHDETKKV